MTNDDIKAWFRKFFDHDFSETLSELPDSVNIVSWANGYTKAYIHLRDKILGLAPSDENEFTRVAFNVIPEVKLGDVICIPFLGDQVWEVKGFEGIASPKTVLLKPYRKGDKRIIGSRMPFTVERLEELKKTVLRTRSWQFGKDRSNFVNTQWEQGINELARAIANELERDHEHDWSLNDYSMNGVAPFFRICMICNEAKEV
jgi:hypothetical protein